MSPIIQLTLSGASGKKYLFTTVPQRGTPGIPGTHGNFAVLSEPQGFADPRPVYIGSTECLSDLFSDPWLWKAQLAGGNQTAWCTSTEATRLSEAADLIAAYNVVNSSNQVRFE